MKQSILAAAVVSALATTATTQADTVGLYLGVDGWNMGSSGQFGTDGLQPQEFTLDDETRAVFHIALEHPVPVLPNIRLRSNDLSSSGDAVIIDEFEFNGVVYPLGEEVNVDFDIQNTDFTLYYELVNNDVVSFDLGITGKYIDGDITVTSASDAVSVSFNGVVPMLYGALSMGVPTTGFSVFGEVSGLAIDDNTVLDYQAGVAYSFVEILPMDLSLRAGYREFSLKLDDLDDISTDWSYDGPFAGMQAHF